MDNQALGKDQLRNSDSSDSTALIIEIIFGVFGLLGMGWLYAGNWLVSIAVFLVFLVFVFIELTFGLETLGLLACILIPLNVSISVVSGLKVRDYVRNRQVKGSILRVVLGFVLGGAILFLGAGLLLFGSALLGGLLEALLDLAG